MTRFVGLPLCASHKELTNITTAGSNGTVDSAWPAGRSRLGCVTALLGYMIGGALGLVDIDGRFEAWKPFPYNS